MFNKNYKRIIVMALLVSIFALTLSGCSNNSEGLVAKVGDDEITEEEFNEDFELYKAVYEKQFGEDVMSQEFEEGETFEDTLKDQIMEKLIIEKILFAEAKAKDIVVEDEEIKAQMELSIEEIGGEEEFEKYLEENELTRKILEENTRKEMLVAKYGEVIKSEMEITDKEAKEYFESSKEELAVIRPSHILVQEEEKGKELLARIENGEEFESIAMMESMDDGSAMNGGDLGYIARGSMIAEFEEVAFELEPGEISDLVKTEVGYHIIRLDDKKDTYEDLEEEIKYLMKEQKYLEKVDELRKSTKVEFFGEFNTKE